MSSYTPPKPGGAHRRGGAGAGATRLPADGRKGPIPRWPLGSTLPGEALSAIWRKMWQKPQAVMWEKLWMHEIVARYCILSMQVEMNGMDRPLEAAISALEDRLGLNPLAMQRLRWVVESEEDSMRTGPPPRRTPSGNRAALFAVNE